MTALVFHPDRGVGDLMWHIPTLRALAERYGGPIALATRPSTRAKELLAVEPAVGEIDYLTYHAGFGKRWREAADIARLCRRIRPEAVWVLEKTWPGAFGAFLAGVPERRGFGLGHLQELWLSPGPRLPAALRPAHRIDKLAALEAAYGLDVPSRDPKLPVDPRLKAEMAARFSDAPRPWVVLGVGGNVAGRRWPMDRFAALARGIADLTGTLFWLGGPEDSPTIEALGVLAERRPRSIDVCSLKLDAAGALMAQSDLFVGNNSGPMNLAASVGCETIPLLGPDPPPRFTPSLHPVVSPDGKVTSISAQTAIEGARERLLAQIKT